ncbi:MAG: translation elongation factor Ts [Bacteroidia bacterium]|nr:translation elongation factor Ts [Bacteroidia bacterium]
MAISAQDVNKLRQMTGAGMMDCKKSLEEANGDFEKAVELLRKKGQKVMASRADRDAREGAVFARVNADHTKAIIIELNCETDFVAKNADFIALGNSIADAVINTQPATLDDISKLTINGKSVSDLLVDNMGKIGEKLDVSKYETLSGSFVATYTHLGSRLAAAIAFDNANGVDLKEAGKELAIQIAAMNPLALDKEDIPKEIIDKELDIAMDQIRQEGKPENMVEKIAQGKLRKFFDENTLLNQSYLNDNSKTVSQYLKEINPKVRVIGMKRVQLGTK